MEKQSPAAKISSENETQEKETEILTILNGVPVGSAKHILKNVLENIDNHSVVALFSES